MLKKTESLAWLILLASFISCLMLAIGIPLSVVWYIGNSARALDVVLQPRAGTITLQSKSSNTALLVSQTTEVPLGSTLNLSEDSDALLLFYPAEDTAVPIVTVQLYGRTKLTVTAGSSPRFRASELPHRVALSLTEAANTQITVESNDRGTEMELRTPHGTIEMGEGSYKVIVEQGQTEFVVNSGFAYIPDPETQENRLALTALQRTTITADGIKDTYIGERDLLRTRNGTFDSPLQGNWSEYSNAYEEETAGTIRQVSSDGQASLTFTRVGTHFAETGIIQVLDQDIRGAQSLRIIARLRIDAQTLGTCGSLGTECPIMIRVEYAEQKSGNYREWLQGFYAIKGQDEPFCQVCSWPVQHIQVAQLGAWYTYESPNLLPLLEEQGGEPGFLHSIQIYASGHTYSSAVDEIAILVGE